MRQHSFFPRLLLGGTHSGSGKTTLMTALLAALSARGIPLQPFKVGPDYIDPAFHSHVTGTPSRNLDSWLLRRDALIALFRRAAPAKGISLIEGVMGLFDGQGSGHMGSSAHVAEILRAPVVLVCDAKGLSRSAAALVSGYAKFSPGISVAGVLWNKVKSERHYALIKRSVETECGVPCFGFLPEKAEFVLKSRHLGLVPSGEVAGLDAIVTMLGRAAADTIDLDALLALARDTPPLPGGDLPPLPRRSPVRIGVARDAAFTFYYQDNLDLLREAGAELVPFSPLGDKTLPQDLHGLYLGGGFPEMFAEALAANTSLRENMRTATAKGLPVYAECGGMVYLCASLTDMNGNEFPMAGCIGERVIMTNSLHNFGYAEAEFLRDTLFGPAGVRVRVHEFHYSRIESPQAAQYGCIRLTKDGREPRLDGFATDTLLAVYPHIHFYSNPALAENFVARCARYRDAKTTEAGGGI